MFMNAGERERRRTQPERRENVARTQPERRRTQCSRPGLDLNSVLFCFLFCFEFGGPGGGFGDPGGGFLLGSLSSGFATTFTTT